MTTWWSAFPVIIVAANELTDAMRAQIEDIVSRKTGVEPQNIIISPVAEN